MSNVKITLNREGVRQLLQSAEMMKICQDHASSAASMLGAGYEVTSRTGKNRVNAEVAAVSAAAKRENMKNNTILKAVRAT